jgi:hypothetical protein
VRTDAPRARSQGAAASIRALAAAGIALVALVGCRTPQGPEAAELYAASLDLLLERTIRAQRVGQTVSLSGAGICRDLAPVPGMAVIRVDGLERQLRDAAARRFGARNGVFIADVFGGLPAADSGLKPGDRIVEISGAEPRVPTWLLLRAGVRAVPPLVLPEVAQAQLELHIERGGERTTASLPVRQGCASPVSLAISDSVNAFAWRDHVVVLSGLMRFMRRDEPLALVVGHEIAHVVLGHTKRSTGSSVDAERDADYLGAYLASRAGYELHDSDYELLRLSYEDPMQLAARATSHPTGPARQLAFERALAEIQRKRESGIPLVPEGFE